MNFLQLRSSPSGVPFVGENEGDTVLWDAALRLWKTGPGGGGGGAVDSVFGRTGVVVAASGDYDSDQIDNLSTVPGPSVSDALDSIGAAVVLNPAGRAASFRYNGVLDNGPSGAAIAIDLNACDLQSVTLDDDTTITLSPPDHPCDGVLVLAQDVAGGHVVGFAGASNIAGAPFANPTGEALTFVPWFFDGATIWLNATPGPPVGRALTDANLTRNLSDGSQLILPPGTLTQPRTLDFGALGSPEVDIVIEIQVFAQAHDYDVENGAANPGPIYTVAAGTQRTVHIKWNGDDWYGAGLMVLV